jgi:hypothetical protein
MSRTGDLTLVGLVIVVLLLLAITSACGDDGGSRTFGYDDDAPLSVRTAAATAGPRSWTTGTPRFRATHQGWARTPDTSGPPWERG